MPTTLDVIAMDGPAAAGKSTVAQRVAERLGYTYFDTGLLYRAVTREALLQGIDLVDEDALQIIAKSIPVRIRDDHTVDIDGIVNFQALRSQEIDANVSQVAAYPKVREALIDRQRQVASAGRVVMVGRDITTIVVPDARLRIFLDASTPERARRRHLELLERGLDVEYDDVLTVLQDRDQYDSTRETAPLVKEAGVDVVDTDEKSIDEVVDEIVARAAEQHQTPVTPESHDSSANMNNGFSFRRRAMNLWAWPVLRTVFRIQQVGLDHVPLHGPLLFVSNHLHNFDPMLEYYAFPRPLHFMGKREAFDVPVVGQAARLSGGFPVNRGSFDREAIRHVEARVEQGIAVGIYPEGGRSTTGSLVEGKTGAGFVALKTGAPVLPVAITGSERLPINGKKGRMQANEAPRDPRHPGVRITYGEPFLIRRVVDGTKIRPQDATLMIMAEIARLLPFDYRGVYQDVSDSHLERFKVPYSFGSTSLSSSSAP